MPAFSPHCGTTQQPHPVSKRLNSAPRGPKVALQPEAVSRRTLPLTTCISRKSNIFAAEFICCLHGNQLTTSPQQATTRTFAGNDGIAIKRLYAHRARSSKDSNIVKAHAFTARGAVSSKMLKTYAPNGSVIGSLTQAKSNGKLKEKKTP